MWPVKIGTNLTIEEVLALEDAGFQLQQREALSPRRQFQTVKNLPIPRIQFPGPGAPDTHPALRNNKNVRRSSTAPTAEHRNKWESASLMDGIYISDVVTVPHPGYGAIIDILSHSNQKYNVTISSFPTCNCPDFKAMETVAQGEHRK